jgi:uncharacterized membrane protein
LGKARIETLADGVFAIAMTLLVLDIHVPSVPAEELNAALERLLPKLATFALSFILLGIYWVAHHAMLHYVRHTDRPFLWINVVFLMTVALVPFSAALLSAYWRTPTAVVVYAGNLMLVAGTLLCLWRYATRRQRLVDRELDPALIRVAERRIWFGFGICSTAVLVSFWSPAVTLVLFVVMIVYYVLPGRVDRFWNRPAPGKESR